jgi:epoxyqueuosine reductase
MVIGLTSQLREMAMSQGASSMGVAGADRFEPELKAMETALSEGRAGPLGFTYDDPGLATDVKRSFPWASRVVVIGCDYLDTAGAPSKTGALVGRFATQDHYDMVRKVTDLISAELIDLGFRAETLIDDNRLVDRGAAIRAGVGWLGKSTMVLAPGHGPWMLLGSVVTDAPLETTAPMIRDCGTCDLCIPACPTGALGTWGLDARRCLSTWLQTPGSIPQWIRPKLGRRVYGCDDCLTACPPGKPALTRSPGTNLDLPFGDLLSLSDEDLLHRFSWWFVPRREGRFLRRNLLVAAGNSAEDAARPSIVEHLDHPSSMIRSHAYWALARGFGAQDLLRSSLDAETVREARDELILALLMTVSPEGHSLITAADEWARGNSDIRALAMIGENVASDDEPQLLVLHRDPEPTAPGPALGMHVKFRQVDDRGAVLQTLVSIYDPDRLLERMR